MSDKNTLGLSRRRVLGGLGAIGVASAGAGLGTTAYFSDEESFVGNILEAGSLDLYVDYTTSVDQGQATGGTGSTTESGTIQGEDSAVGQYQISDVKPGDSGKLVFCPKIVDNPAWLWVGGDGITDYENGQTEPESEVDVTGGGSVDNVPSGEGEGELSEKIQVTVSYCELSENGDPENPDDYTVIRELNNPSDYTLADLALELQKGFLLDGDTETAGTQAYPGSGDSNTQEGPCICIEWNVPTTVGNEIQTDSLEFDIEFHAEQERHNESPQSPFVDYSVSSESELRDAVSNSSTGDVIALSGDVSLTSDLSLSGQIMTSAIGSDPTLEVNGGRLNLGTDTILCRLDIELNNGNVMYSPSESTGLKLLGNTITMSPSSEHGIRLEGTSDYSHTVIAGNEFTQEGPVQVGNAQGVIVSGRKGVMVENNQFTGYDPGGSNPDYNGQAVLVTSQGQDAGYVEIADNGMDYWNNGVFILENQNEISDVSVTANGISGTDETAIVAFDDTGSDGFENLNGEDTESAQEVALEQDNSFNNTNGNVDVILS